MIIGAHSIIYSKKSESDREFLREALGLPHVDAGHGWLIRASPEWKYVDRETEMRLVRG